MTSHTPPVRKFLRAIALSAAVVALATGGTAAAADLGTPVPVAGPPGCC